MKGIKLYYILVILYLSGVLINYFTFMQKVRSQALKIEELNNKILKNERKKDSITILKNQYIKIDSLLNIMDANEKHEEEEEEEEEKKLAVLKSDKNKNTYSRKNTFSNSKLQNSEDNDSLKIKNDTLKVEKENKLNSKKKKEPKPSSSKILGLFNLDRSKSYLTIDENFIKVKYDPHNSNLVNSMTDIPQKVKLNNIFAKVISSTEYYGADNKAFYLILIKIPKKTLRLGLNEILVEDNHGRYHIAYFKIFE